MEKKKESSFAEKKITALTIISKIQFGLMDWFATAKSKEKVEKLFIEFDKIVAEKRKALAELFEIENSETEYQNSSKEKLNKKYDDGIIIT